MKVLDEAIKQLNCCKANDAKSTYQDAEKFIDDIERAVQKWLVPHRGDLNSAAYAQLMDAKIKFERAIISTMQRG